MKEYQINLYGKQMVIKQDDDGKFLTPDFIKEQNKFGSCLKPAYEPIIVARKPFKGSLVDNVLKNGVGGLNIDECRVGAEKRVQWSGKASNGNVYFEFPQNNAHFETVEGRFPANVILTYDENDFGEVCGGMPNENGLSASRYLYCAKANSKDRDEGLDLAGFEIVQITDGSVRANPKTGGAYNANPAPKRNIHPTVKPTELMEYLIKLVAPKGSVILDPFMGSGSTGKAVMFQNRERNANYHFIGIEMTDEYLPIAKARIDYAKYKYQYDEIKEKEERKRKGIINIFDLIGDENE